MNEILRFMQKRDERTDRRTDVRKAFYNLPTSAFGRMREIKKQEESAREQALCQLTEYF